MHQRKYPKSVSRGRSPWTPPAQKRCQHSFPASETRRYADSFDGLRPCSQQLSAVVRTQVTAWPGDGQGFVSRLAGRRNRFRALPVQAPQGGVLSNHPGGTRAEPVGGTFQVSMLPPEGEHGTPTDAPVALPGILRGRQAWRVGRPLAHSSWLDSPLSDSLPTFCSHRK